MAKTDEKTIQEIECLYPDEWVLVEETAWDDTEMPVRGRVLVHSLERDILTPHVRQAARAHPDIKLFVFYTGDKIDKDVVPILKWKTEMSAR